MQALYQHGFEQQTLLDMYAVIDWMLWLPSEPQRAFRQELAQYEEETRMRYVTSNERIAKAEGVQQGLHQGQAKVLARLLVHRFGELPEWAQTRLSQAEGSDLEAWTEALLSAGSIEQVFGEARH